MATMKGCNDFVVRYRNVIHCSCFSFLSRMKKSLYLVIRFEFLANLYLLVLPPYSNKNERKENTMQPEFLLSVFGLLEWVAWTEE